VLAIPQKVRGWLAIVSLIAAPVLAGVALALPSHTIASFWNISGQIGDDLLTTLAWCTRATILALAAMTVWLARSLRRPTPPLDRYASSETSVPPLDEIQFTVYRPKTVRPCEWYPLIAFAHLADRRPDTPQDEPDPMDRVRAQAKQILGTHATEFRDTTVDARRAVPRRGEITLLPHAPGIEFNPERRTFHWLEDIHHEEFRLRAAAELEGTTARGRLSVYLGVILLAEVDLAIKVDSSYSQATDKTGTESAGSTARPYRKIFASYSHKDTEIVSQYEAFLQTSGDRYLRDVRDLRSGEDWDSRLLDLIAQADIFQLFWSSNSMQSPFVQREWEYALGLGRPHFIRPTYWEDPLPESPNHALPPEELRKLHFHRIPGELVASRSEGDSLSTKDRKRRSRSVPHRVLGMSFLLAVGFLLTSFVLLPPRTRTDAPGPLGRQPLSAGRDDVKKTEDSPESLTKTTLEHDIILLIDRLDDLWSLKNEANLRPSKQGRTVQSIRDMRSRLEVQLQRKEKQLRELTPSDREHLAQLIQELDRFLSPPSPDFREADRTVDVVYERMQWFSRELDMLGPQVDGSPNPKKPQAPSRKTPE
jgi:hypothetical protein